MLVYIRLLVNPDNIWPHHTHQTRERRLFVDEDYKPSSDFIFMNELNFMERVQYKSIVALAVLLCHSVQQWDSCSIRIRGNVELVQVEQDHLCTSNFDEITFFTGEFSWANSYEKHEYPLFRVNLRDWARLQTSILLTEIPVNFCIRAFTTLHTN